MPLLSPVMVTLRQPYAPLFQARTWAKAHRLLIGPGLAPGQRTVSIRWDCMKKAILRCTTRCSTAGPAGPRARWAGCCGSNCSGTWHQPGAPDLRHRRNHRASPGPSERGLGHLPGQGVFLPGPLRPGHGAARDQPAGADRDPLGAAGLGPPLSHRAGPLCAVCRGPGSAPQDCARLGPPDAAVPAPLGVAGLGYTQTA